MRTHDTTSSSFPTTTSQFQQGQQAYWQKIHPQWLHSFRMLIDTQHFTQAAQRLCITQSAISQQIKKLEDACGCDLIKRYQKRFTITEQGQQVYQYACQQAQAYADLMSQIQENDPQVGPCHISCSGTIATQLFQELVQLQLHSPSLTMHVQAVANQTILRHVENGTSALGLVNHQPDSDRFEVEYIGQSALSLVFPAAKPLPALAASSLITCGLVDHPDAAYYLRYYLQHVDDAQLAGLAYQDLPVRVFVNQLHQILYAVHSGLGFTILPAKAVAICQQTFPLKLAISNQQVSEPVYLVSLKNRPLPPRYQQIITTIKALAY